MDYNNIDNNKNDNYDYIKYLTLKKMNEKIIKSGKKGIELENEIYSKNKVPLTEKEKIYFEISRIYFKIKGKKNYDNLIKENKNLYLSITKFIKQLVDIEKNNFNNYDSLKKSIVNLQIDLNMKSGFYSIVPSMLEEYDNRKGKELIKYNE